MRTNNYLSSDYQNFIALSRYARWKEEDQRREGWLETVERYFNYLENYVKDKYGYMMPDDTHKKLIDAVQDLNVMPSMRALMTAGAPLDVCHVPSYNCSYLTVDTPRAFDECMYVLMCGTGVGFSVEKDYVEKLPTVNEQLFNSDTVIKVRDSRIGWAKSLKELIAMLYSGQIPTWDVSEVRPAGARLKTFGGRASGAGPLEKLFNFCIEKFKGAVGRKLTPLECHDIMCKVGDVVVVGGVRRSALISLSDIDDGDMRHAKSGEWYIHNPQRTLANNSVAYERKPNIGTFIREWTSLYESYSGERGIFNRQAANKQVAKNGRRDGDHAFGCNPCSEIILRPFQFCNLSEVVARNTDTLKTLKEKVKLATILGTLQSTLTDFKYLRKIWKTNTEEERLLGVSLTGIMDCPLLNGTQQSLSLPDMLEELKQVAVDTNREIAEAIGINMSVAITCVKPSGTVSQLVDSASGIHARHSPYYIRTVRADNKDPMTQFMIDQGIPNEPEKDNPLDTTVFSFPTVAPMGAVTRNDMTATEQLDLWLTYQTHWCEHKPSVTISVRDSEWMEVGAWVYKNFDDVSGISFLPYSDHIYPQAPYEEVDKAKCMEMVKRMPSRIDWSKLSDYEKEDGTSGGRELACSAGVCEVVDLTT
tara:strand:- start:7697 stop:9634 length:1938 start_codon:yes stop_codon:yes gene_type:complete